MFYKRTRRIHVEREISVTNSYNTCSTSNTNINEYYCSLRSKIHSTHLKGAHKQVTRTRRIRNALYFLFKKSSLQICIKHVFVNFKSTKSVCDFMSMHKISSPKVVSIFSLSLSLVLSQILNRRRLPKLFNTCD